MRCYSIILVILLLARPTSAQDISDLVNSYIGDNAKPYLQPLNDLFVSNLHTGIKEWSRVDTSFHIRLGLVVMASFPTSSMRSFTGKTGEFFEPTKEVEVPTIIGDINPVTVDGINGTAFVFPGGYNLEYLPMATPQLTLEGLFNTELTGRFLAFDLEEDLGKISLFGIGLRHGLNAYIPSLPIDVSVGYFYHQLDNDPYIFSKMHLASVFVGKSWKLLSTQLMLGYQKSTMDIDYIYTDAEGDQSISLNFNNTNNFVAEASLGLKVWFLSVHGAIQYSGPVTGALGVGLRF